MLKTELKKENQYLTQTKTIISDLIDKNKDELNYLSESFSVSKKDLSNNSQTDDYEAVSINTTLEDINIRASSLYSEINKLQNVLNKPFFAKIVFESALKEKAHYIGLKNIVHNNNFYVVDWRAPISSLYYDSNIGKTHYASPSGPVEVNLKFKRQFTLQNNEIVNYFDSGSYINDEILKEALSKGASHYMHNIVSTIQHEQDKIIREDITNNIIINGVAGSGKTSVAMHRIAYLLYKYRDKINNSNIVIVSPNRLFSNYISKLLPELGEDAVTIKSFYDILIENVSSVQVIDSKTRLISDIMSGNAQRWKLAKAKYSQKYLNILLKYIKQFNNINIFANLTIGNKAFSLKQILPYFKKFKKDFNVYETVRNTIFTLVTQYFPQFDTKQQESLIEKTTAKVCSNLNPVKIANNFLNKLDGNQNTGHKIHIEDLPTFALINMATNGYISNNNIKHLLIDEMQDYDAVTLKIIELLYCNATFTIVGDFNQNLLFDTNNLESLNEIFQNSKYVNLSKSYRSTNNITELAQKIIGSYTSRQTIREGNNPEFKQCLTKQDVVQSISNLINSISKNETTAIICKNEREASFIHRQLNKGLLVTSEHAEINDDILIITTTYFCKGLEFDNVIIPNASALNYKNNLERQNLYISVTRALHNVYGFYLKTPSKFISEEFLAH